MNSQPHPNPYVGEFDPSLNRVRTHSDDYYDHRMMTLKHVRDALAAEKMTKRKR